MKINSQDFCVGTGDKVRLKDWSTKIKPLFQSKPQYDEILQAHVKKLDELQQLHYASDRHALMIIFQGMDGSGKDGAIRHVMSGINPEGCDVYSFKQPSHEELEHDFLWREVRHLPERGRIGIFNRSYYEEVLVTKVHPELLAQEGFTEKHKKKFWEGRYQSIRNFESHLHRNNTRVIKIFLHLSQDEQKKRFLERIDQPDKNWKFSVSDIRERKYWKNYMKVYEECLSATSAGHAPWYIVPADDKENARLIVSQIILDTFEDLKMSYPKPTSQRWKELKSIRKSLEKKAV
jgi:PPK2 family polyphosphate:nucleotide phosphotransferase